MVRIIVLVKGILVIKISVEAEEAVGVVLSIVLLELDVAIHLLLKD